MSGPGAGAKVGVNPAEGPEAGASVRGGEATGAVVGEVVGAVVGAGVGSLTGTGGEATGEGVSAFMGGSDVGGETVVVGAGAGAWEKHEVAKKPRKITTCNALGLIFRLILFETWNSLFNVLSSCSLFDGVWNYERREVLYILDGWD